MLPPTADQGTSPPTRAKGRGTQRAKIEEISTSELLSLLKEMKSEMKEGDEQIRKELRWRDNHLEDQIKKK